MKATSISVVLGLTLLLGWTSGSGCPRLNFNCENRRLDAGVSTGTLDSSGLTDMSRGVGLMVFFSPHVGLRGGVRHIHSFQNLDAW